MRYDLNNSFTALNESVTGNSHIANDAGFIPAGGIIFYKNSGHSCFFKSALFNQYGLSGCKEKASCWNMATYGITDMHGWRPCNVFYGIIRLNILGIGIL